MSKPTNRHVAHAIADLATEQVRAAWRYLDTYAALEAGGVPPAQVRDVMDREAVSTIALDDLRTWARDGERGLMVLHGGQDNGKTFAAAKWAHERHARGLPTMWISAAKWGRLTFEEIRPLLRRAERADALVIDDAGCGESQGEHFRRTMEALFLERADRPTVVTGNLNKTEMRAWLGERICSRLRVTGGCRHIEQTLGMRKRDLEPVDAWGRGETWHRAHKIISLIGCERSSEAVYVTEPDDYGGTYQRATGSYRERLDVGRELEARVCRARTDKDASALLREATRLTGLEPAEVWEAAQALVGTVSDLDAGAFLAEAAKQIAAKLQADNQRRSDVCQEVLAELEMRRRRAAAIETSIAERMHAPGWTRTEEGIAYLSSMFMVVKSWDGFALHRRQGRKRGPLMACGAASKAAAWECAARLCGEEPKPRPPTVDRVRPLPPEGPS